MKNLKLTIVALLLLIMGKNLYAQYMPDTESDVLNDVIEVEDRTAESVTTRGGFADFYNDLRTWIPYCNSEPLKNPPITYIEVSFHVLLDDNGGNNQYTNTTNGKNRLLSLLQHVNSIYSHAGPPSIPVQGVTELPNYDTRIRFTLGDTGSERIYFYDNTTHNRIGYPYGDLYKFVADTFPTRLSKLNVFFTAGYWMGRVQQGNIDITNGGSGYTSPPTITFMNVSPTKQETAAIADAVIQNGVLTGINIRIDTIRNPNDPTKYELVIRQGSYHGFIPPQIIISGGGGSGATAIVTKLASGATGYAYLPSSTSLSLNHNVVMCHCHEANDAIYGLVLTHELGHVLDLKHTVCDGASTSPVICSNHCSMVQGTKCSGALCSDDEYLSDIFGPCPGTYPFVGTPNIMGGGTGEQIYFSPMQAGQMHRALALKSIRKYVKEGTYSSIPLVINDNENWSFNLKLYRDVTIAAGKTLTISNTFELPDNGKITVKNGAALIVQGTVKLKKNNQIVVETGGTLLVKQGSTTEISNNGYIEVRSGGYFCINSGATIKLHDAHSVILLKPGYINGVNTSLLPQSTCVASPVTYSIIGNGGIKDYTGNVYIQNETISSNKYYTGTNIYVGRNVTSSKPQSDVIINNNANVIFDATQDVILDAGFECALGATFEIK